MEHKIDRVAGSLRGENILLVEPRYDGRIALSAVVADTGGRVAHTARTAREAVEIARRHQLTLILFGPGSPVAITVCAAREIRASDEDVCLIAFTSDEREPILDALYGSGFDAVYPSCTATYGLRAWPTESQLYVRPHHVTGRDTSDDDCTSPCSSIAVRRSRFSIGNSHRYHSRHAGRHHG